MKEKLSVAPKKLGVAFVLCCLALSAAGCGLLNNIAKIPQPTPMSVAGNWQFDLMDSKGNGLSAGI